MSANNVAKVKNVKIRVLEIQELENPDSQSIVIVELTRGNPTGSVGGIEVFQGEMTYNNGKKDQPVDQVEAVFSSGTTDEHGNIALQINLTDGNKFDPNTDPITTVPTPGIPDTVPTHCVTVGDTSDDGSMITITFQEPREGEFIAYPALYFHTVEGVIDPGVGVKRKPD